MQSKVVIQLPQTTARAKAMVRSVVANWAVDTLALRRRGLLRPSWEGLNRATAGGSLARPPRPLPRPANAATQNT